MEKLSENEAIEKYRCRTIGCLYGKIYKDYGGTCIFKDCPNRSIEWTHIKEIDMPYIADRQHEVDALNAYYNTASICKTVGKMLKDVDMKEAGDIVCKGAETIRQMAEEFQKVKETLRMNGFKSVYHLLSEYGELKERGREPGKQAGERTQAEKDGSEA